MRQGIERPCRRRKQTRKADKGWLPAEDTESPLSLRIFSRLERFWTGSQWTELMRGINIQTFWQRRWNPERWFMWTDEGNDCTLENPLLIKAACLSAWMKCLAIMMKIIRIVLWRCWRQRSGRVLEMYLSLATLVRMVSVWKHRKSDWKTSKADERE